MRVFLTGATGFIGSSVLRQLIQNERHEVAILLRENTSLDRITDVAQKVLNISGSLDDCGAFEDELFKFQPDVILHLAWNGVGGDERNHVHQWRNVHNTLELIELTKRTGALHWIGLGSQAEYGPCQDRIDELTATHPTTLYGESKLASCNLSIALCRELGLRHAWLRLFSSYGPNDNQRWLIPYLIKSFLRNEKPLLTPAEQKWDYIYVEDVASAIIAVLETSSARGVFNLGSGSVQPLRTIVENIRGQINSSLPIGFGEVPYRPDQVMHLEANIQRLRQATGWRPKYDLSSGLEKTISWYKSHELSL
jgi:UDP-glucose 4-epimerase